MTRLTSSRMFTVSRSISGSIQALVLLGLLSAASAQAHHPMASTLYVAVKSRGTAGTDGLGGADRIRALANLEARPKRSARPTSPPANHLPLFLEAPQYQTGSIPSFVAVGDFNGDGRVDLAVTSYSDDAVSVLLGNGDGTFQAFVDYATGTAPVSIAAGDFNGDGRLDLAVTNYGSNTVSVLLGNGDGTFKTHVDYPAGTGPDSVAVGDFNGDGKLDLAVVNYGSNNVSVLLGNGDGTFKTHVDYTTGTNPTSVVAGDFNGDGTLDLAVTNAGSNNVSVLLGNGDGTLKTHVDYPTGTAPASVAVGDFNGDGKLDLAVANYSSNNMSVLLGNGDGTFMTPVDYTTGTNPTAVAAGDFNGDGTLDLAVTNAGSNNVSVFLGNGGGTFSLAENDSTGDGPTSVAALSLSIGGYPPLDLVVANAGSQSISVMLANLNGFSVPGVFDPSINYPTGGALFQASPTYTTGNSPVSVAAGDFNGDGKPDLAVANQGSNTVSVLLGNGDGTFKTHVDYPTGTGPESVAVGDFNGDGKLDLAVVNYSSNNMSVLLGNGDGTFKTHVDYTTGTNPTSVVAGDFNGDGRLDLAVANYGSNTVSVLLGKGDGTFLAHVDYSIASQALSAVVGDFNGDGKLDLVVGGCVDLLFCGGVQLVTFLGVGDGTFRAGWTSGIGPDGPFATGDFNGDGKLDLAFSVPCLKGCLDTLGYMAVLLGNGDGTFLEGDAFFGGGQEPGFVALGDFNADGKPDLAVSNYNPTSVGILLGNGDGTFQASMNYAAEQTVGAVVDFNNDGAPDLAVTNRGEGISILLNVRGTILNLQSSANPSDFGQAVSLTATMQASLNGIVLSTPTGTVTFLDGTTKLGSSTLSANAVATLSTAALAAGTHNIVAVYGGDNNFNPHTSSPLSQVVKPQDFGLKAAPDTATVSPGSQADFTVTATAENGFNGSVSLTCSVSPTPALVPTCALNPTAMTPTAGGSTSKLTVSTFAPTASLKLPASGHDMRPVYVLWLAAWGLALFVVCAAERTTKKTFLGSLPVGLGLMVLTLQLACAGGGNKNGGGGTPAGNYTITVSAGSGSTTHATSVSLTVQ